MGAVMKDMFFHTGRIYGYRREHETPREAIIKGAAKFICDVQGFNEFHDAVASINNITEIIASDLMGLFIETDSGSIISIEDVYKLEIETCITQDKTE